MTHLKSILAGAGVSLLMTAAMAQAADLGPIYAQAPELTPVEIGSGWYLRGDVSYDFQTDLGGSQRFFKTYGSHVDGFDTFRLNDGFDIGGGIGYQITDWLRTDTTLHYWQHEVEAENTYSLFCAFGPTCGSKEQGDVEAYEVMANAYVDLGTIAGFTPYVGAGAGAVHLSYDDIGANGYCLTGFDCGAAAFAKADYEGEDNWRFAYALMGGMSYAVSPELSLDVGYRYLNVDDGDAYSFDPTASGGTGIYGKDDGFDRHTIQAGIRYKIW